ncbi:MAG: hypothetical protein AAF389_12235 [Gemmatimonadota bacterium]
MSGSEVDALLSHVETLLADGGRARVLDEVTERGSFEDHLRRLRTRMGEHGFGSDAKALSKCVRRLDNRTRQDGFRVLHAWDHQEHAFSRDVVPALLLDFFVRSEVDSKEPRTVLGILLDYYFLHLLALAAMRAWDTDDPDSTMGRVHDLLGLLQGSAGSGHHFVEDAETLLIHALSQFHPEEQAYDRIIERVGHLSAERQLRFAIASAAVLSAHLRWGFWLMYGRDVVRMRDDNVGDYPWLLWTIGTLLEEFTRSTDDAPPPSDVVTALVQALAADPWLLEGGAPSALEPYRDRHGEIVGQLRARAVDLVSAMEGDPPRKDRYHPLSLHFNFPHNALVAITTLALLESKPQPLPINALFKPEIEGLPEEESQERLARLLMHFSSGSPDRLGRRGAMLVAYDPLSAMRSHSMTRDVLKRLGGVAG